MRYKRQVAACVGTSRQSAQDILDYSLNGKGYIYWYGWGWAVFTS